MVDKNKSVREIIIIVLAIGITIAGLLFVKSKMDKKEDNKGNNTTEKETKEEQNVILVGNFNIDIIRQFNAKAGESNYLLSPYNIEMALNMLRDGSDGETKDQMDKVLGNRTINNIEVANKIGIANGVFIKNAYKNNVKDDYYNIMKTKYNSDIIYDDFVTPEKINNWVKDKTWNMIEKVLDDVDEDFVMGLASALAIDVKWQSEFECDATRSEEFTKADNTKMNTEMMHDTYKYGSVKYIKTDDAEGIVLPYKKEADSNVELEFIGILPNSDVDTYVNSLTKDKITNLIDSETPASDKLHVHLSLPRFTYDYEEKELGSVLINMGIKDVFSQEKANLKKMVEIENKNAYVGTAIHKTHIELNETGTKAAAVTYFGVEGTGIMPQDDYEEVSVIFNKPFIYMIREKNTGEILFFGSVYEPNEWKGSTCSDN